MFDVVILPRKRGRISLDSFPLAYVFEEVNNAHLTLLDAEKRAQVIAILDEAKKHAEKEHKKKVSALLFIGW